MAITYSQHADLTLADIHALVRWEAVNTAARLAIVVTEVDNDKVCKQTDNNSYWVLADYSGPTWVEWTSAGIAAVTSVFGEIGDVDETDANFTAADIANVAAGNIIATDVQAALNELDAEKTPLTHTHVVSQITNAGTATFEDVGVTVGDVPQLEDIGGGVPGLPAVDGSQLTGVAGGGSAITVTDEGGAPLTTDVQSFDFVGAGVTASNVGDDVTITIAPGSAPIDTVFSRTGTVVATASDYDASLIDNDSSVTGAFVDDALNTLDTDKAESTDARFPTTDEKGALAGTGTPSGSNLYVTADTLAAKTHTLSEITDAGTAAGKDTGVGNDDVPLLAQGPYTTDGTLTLDDGAGNTVNVMGWGIYQGTTNADYFEFGGETQATPRLTYFRGARSNADATKAGAVIVSGGVAAGTNSSGGDLEIYGGVGTAADGDIRIGGYDNAGTDVPVGGDVRMLKGFTIAETASAPYTTAAGRGQLWPRTSDGAIMWTDSSDVDHDLTTSGSGTMVVEEEGSPVAGGPHDTMNFIGGGVTAADGGGGTVTVTIAPGAAPIDTVFSRTGTVVAVAGDYTATQITNSPAGDVAAVTVQGAINELDTDKAAVGHTQAYTTVDGVPTDTFLGRDTAGTGATEAMNLTTARDLLNVQDGSVAAGTAGDAHVTADGKSHSDVVLNNAKRSYPVADEALVDGHETTLANVATPITTVGAALLDDATVVDQRATLGLGTAAVENVGVTIDDLVQLVNVGGNPGFPAVDGSLLTGIDVGAPITVVDETTTLTAALSKMTFTGTGVVASEPGVDGEIVVTVTSGAPGVIDITDGTTTVNSADLLTFNATAFDVVDQGANDALLNPIFGTGAGAIAEGDHTHDTLANVATNVILGRDTAGTGLSEELTPAEARGVIGVALGNILSGTKADLNLKVADATIIANNEPTSVPLLNDFARFVDHETIEGRSYTETRSDLGIDSLANLNTTLSTTIDETTDARPADEIETSGTNVTVSATAPGGADEILITTSATAASWGTVTTNAITDDAVTLAKIDAHTGAVAGVLGYGASGVPSEVSSSATVGHVLKGAGTGAAPVFGQLVADSYGTGTIAVTRLADGTDGELITWSAAGVATTVAAGTATHVLTSNGPDTVPTFQVAPGGAPTLSKSITIPDPVTSEDISFFYTPVAITITQIAAAIRGTTPSVLWFIKHATMTAGRDSAGAAVVTAGTTTTDEGGVSITSFDDATIPADSFLWIETTTVSGTNDELALTIVYTED